MQTRLDRQPLLIALTIVVGCLALLGVSSGVAHFLVVPYNPGFAEHPLITRTHVIMGAFYLTLAPLQLSREIRARALNYHRWAGRALVGAATLVGLSALFLGLIVPFSGNPERVVIAVFGSLFLASLALGVRQVRRGRIAEHREWMLRAFAIGLSIATMRLVFIPTLMIMPDPTDADIATTSIASFTASFLLHTTVAEIWIRRSRRHRLTEGGRGPLHVPRTSLTPTQRQPPHREQGSDSGPWKRKRAMKTDQPGWTGMVPVDDTALFVHDTGGHGRPVVYLNGAYANQSHWRRVITDLGGDYRHITYDERARGKSQRSKDYSFEACLRDLDAVLKARRVAQPLPVGWSYGGVLAWHWADRNPDRVCGVVCVDAFPVGLTGHAGHERIRKMFRQWRLLFPIAARLGLAARMSADQHADVNIELNEIAAASVPVLDRLTIPVRFVLATGDSLGSQDGEMEQGRATLDDVLLRNPHLKLSAKVPSNHSKILRNDSPTVARAVRELANPSGPRDRLNRLAGPGLESDGPDDHG